MSMFCNQCQETAGGNACTVRGVCGKQDDTANLQDCLLYTLKGLSIFTKSLRETGADMEEYNRFLFQALFVTITNVNFDNEDICQWIKKGLALRDKAKAELKGKSIKLESRFKDAENWTAESQSEFVEKGKERGLLSIENEDIRSLKQLLTLGMKGIAAYGEHAAVLDKQKDEIFAFLEKTLMLCLDPEASQQDLLAAVTECGQYGVTVMQLLDEANTSRYGNPEITEVDLGVGTKPGILISGHDLLDLEHLLEQSKDSGVDIYTHGEMLPAHYYPAFKKYPHFAGNYGGSWWKQKSEFKSFNGPVLMTTNCLVPPDDSYKDRIFTTGTVAFSGVKRVKEEKGKKDFSELIEMAKQSKAPQELEKGKIVGGFAHHQIKELADKVIDAVKSGAVKQFVVMAGCDGRMKSRGYYTDFASQLPKDSIILTAGCAKYRYNKLDLGDIGGIPRVLDAGQCNDSYSLAVTALTLKEAFGLDDINDLPIVYNIAWYEQKAVLVLLALLYLGVKKIHLGPTLPGFLTEHTRDFLIENFDLGGISDVDADLKSMLA